MKLDPNTHSKDGPQALDMDQAIALLPSQTPRPDLKLDQDLPVELDPKLIPQSKPEPFLHLDPETWQLDPKPPELNVQTLNVERNNGTRSFTLSVRVGPRTQFENSTLNPKSGVDLTLVAPFTFLLSRAVSARFLGVHSRVLFATRTPNSHNHSYVHYSLPRFTGKLITPITFTYSLQSHE